MIHNVGELQHPVLFVGLVIGIGIALGYLAYELFLYMYPIRIFDVYIEGEKIGQITVTTARSFDKAILQLLNKKLPDRIKDQDELIQVEIREVTIDE